MSFADRLEALSCTASDSKDHRTWPVALGRLRGHRDETKGIEWLFSLEVYDRLGLDPRERRRGWTMRRVADGMKAHGWKRQYVGPRSARESGFCRALRENRGADAVPASPHHGAAVEAFRAALNRLVQLGLSGVQLDRAYDEARESSVGAVLGASPVSPAASSSGGAAGPRARPRHVRVTGNYLAKELDEVGAGLER